MKKILAFFLTALMVLGTASMAVFAAEDLPVAGDLTVSIQGADLTADDIGTVISLEVYLTGVTDEDDLGLVSLGIAYDETKLEFVEVRSKTGTGKKAVSHMADYFDAFTPGPAGANPAGFNCYTTSFENMLWDSDYDINNDIFVVYDFEVLDGWTGETVLDWVYVREDGGTLGEFISRGYNHLTGVTWENQIITMDNPAAEEPESTNNLTVAAEGSGSVTADINGTATTDITAATEFATVAGDAVSLTAVASEGSVFKGWKNALSGAIVSTDATIAWTATGSARSLVAVFEDAAATTNTVIFKDNITGKILKTMDVADGYVITNADLPAAPSIYGYSFSKYVVMDDGTPDAIGYTVNGDVVVRTSNIKDASTAVTLTVNDGFRTFNVTRTYATIATVYASVNAPGTFSYWTLNGKVVSTSPVYQFSMPSTDVELIAVYGAAEIPAASVAIIDNTVSANNTMTTLISRDLAEGLTLIESGILYTRNATEDDLVVPKANPAVTQGISSNTTADTVGFVKDMTDKAGTWLVKAYLVYADGEGNLTTVYSDLVTATIA